MNGHIDLYNNLSLVKLFNPAQAGSSDTPIVSEIIDRANFASVLLAFGLGSLSDSNATFVVLLEDGNASNLSDHAAVDDTLMIGTELLAGFQFDDDNETRKLQYLGNKRYLRITITPTGNTGDVYLGGMAILGGSRVLPLS